MDEDAGGLSMSDLLELPAPQRRLLKWIIREREVGAAQLAEFAAGDDRTVQSTLDVLVERGLVQAAGPEGERRYRAAITSRSTRPRVPSKLWRSLGDGEG